MRVSEWISKYPDRPSTISLKSSINEILSIMQSAPYPRDIYVVDDTNRIIGHLSLKKMAHHLLPTHQPSHTRRQIVHRVAGITIYDLMHTEFNFTKPDEELEDIFPLLLEQEIEELPVIDSKGECIGVLKLPALLQYYVDREDTDTVCKI